MKSLLISEPCHLVWERRADSAITYELRSGDEVYALYNGNSDIPTCETEDGVWSFVKSGFWRPKTYIKDLRSGADCGDIEWKGFGPVFKIEDGSRFLWKYSFLRTSFSVVDSFDQEVLRMESIEWPGINDRCSCSATMQITANGLKLPKIPLLTAAAMYTLLPANMDLPIGSTAIQR